MIQQQHEVRRGESQAFSTLPRDAIVIAQRRRRVGHRVAGAIDDMQAMSPPAVASIPQVVTLIQITPRLIDQTTRHVLDELQGKPLSCLAPGGVGERLAGQMPHRSASDVAASDLPNEPAEGLTGCEKCVAESIIKRAGQRVYAIGKK